MNAQLKPAMPKYFKLLADGTQVPATDPRTDHVAVLDTTRNLEIYVKSVGVNDKPAPVAKLLKAITQLDVLGRGWVHATREEAESILDLSRFDPAVDPNLFPGIRPRAHITSTPCAWAPASASWWVGFNYGLVYDLVHACGSVGWALAVRPAGQ